MKKLSVILALILVFSVLVVQTPSVRADGFNYWARSYGGSGTDVINDVKVLPDGSIIAVGYTTSSGTGGKDVLVMKLSPEGGVAWAKAYGGTKDDVANAVAIAPNGDIIVAGWTASFGAGGSDVWILRLDANGNVKWQKTYGGSKWDEARSVALAPNGDIIVAGYTDSFGAGGAWVLRLDANGNVKWQKTYGGSGTDGATAVAVASNGDVIVAGYTNNFGAGEVDFWVLRLDSEGNVKWQKTYGGSNEDVANAVALAQNGDIIVAGHYGASWDGSGGDAWILRLDADGNVKWQKTYGGSDEDVANAVAIAPNGDVIVAGSTHSFGAGGWDVWVLRLDANGNVKWQKTYGGTKEDRAYAVAIAPNGDIIVAGYTGSFGTGGDDVWVLRLPPDGNLPGFSRDSNAKITIPSPDVRDSKAAVEDSGVTPKDSHAYPNPAELTVKTQYGPALPAFTILSVPPGASVYINGTYEGVTPLTLNLTPGTYEVKLTKQDYKNYTTTITLNPGESKTISATLTPAFGYLSVDSSPAGAKVYVDGDYAGETPLKDYKLPTGEHEVKIVKDGYQNFTKTVTVSPGEKASVTASLVQIKPSQTTTTPTTSSPQTTTSSPSTTSTPSSSSPTTSSSPPTTSIPPTQTAQATAGGGIPKTYIIAGLLVLGLLGGVAAKARGRKPKPSPSSASSVRRAPKKEKPPAPPRVPYFPPELLSKYEPLEFLGEGGFARVYKVKRKKDGKVVAVKVPSLGSEAAKKAFLKEVTAWSRLDHPNIVKLYGAYKTPVPHIEMEYVEGARIRRRLVRDLGAYPVPADEETALKLVRGIAEGLKHAHSKQVFHRDLKPQNVLLKSDLTPKITDWGLAKVGAVSTTATAMKGLTYLYAAPEQVDEKFYGHTDHRTDIYQLGLIFYELLTGGQPYEGSSIVSVMTKITKPDERPKPPSAFNPKLKKYDGIFEKLLAKRKEERYGSVDEFLEALDAVQEIQREKEELKKTTTAMVKSKTRAEFEKLWRAGVLKTIKIARLSLRANDRGELLGALDELRGITKENSKDVEHLIGQVEILVREGVAMSDETKTKVEELLKRIEWEVFRS